MISQLSIHELATEWPAIRRFELEGIIEQTTAAKKSFPINTEESLEYKYLVPRGFHNALVEAHNLIIKRHILIRRTLSEKHQTILDHALSNPPGPEQKNNSTQTEELKSFLNKDKLSAFIRIQNAYSSIALAVALDQTPGLNNGIKLLCAGLHELYSGDQRFFNDRVKTSKEVAKAGGIAKKTKFAESKKKA
ncbi:MAG: hypothetical protein EOP06_19400, partial [Proteobacteria bacterium]